MFRLKGVSWWPEELPSKEEYEEAVRNLERVNWQVDRILTHCARFCRTTYKDRAAGALSAERFAKLSEVYEKEQDELKRSVYNLRAVPDQKQPCIAQPDSGNLPKQHDLRPEQGIRHQDQQQPCQFCRQERFQPYNRGIGSSRMPHRSYILAKNSIAIAPPAMEQGGEVSGCWMQRK